MSDLLSIPKSTGSVGPLPDILKPAVSGLRHRHGPTENWSPKLVAVEKNGDDKDQTWVRVWFDKSHVLLRIIIITTITITITITIIIITIISRTIQKCINKNITSSLLDAIGAQWCRPPCRPPLGMLVEVMGHAKTPKLGGPAEIPIILPIPCVFWIKQLNPVDISNHVQSPEVLGRIEIPDVDCV